MKRNKGRSYYDIIYRPVFDDFTLIEMTPEIWKFKKILKRFRR